MKATVVPRRLGAAPIVSSFDVGRPREKVWRNNSLLRATSITVSDDIAFTTDTPTPCRPPLVA